MKTVKIDGKDYPVEIRNGEPYINGQTIDAFMKGIPHDTMGRLAEIGFRKFKSTMTGDEMHPQEDLAELEFRDY